MHSDYEYPWSVYRMPNAVIHASCRVFSFILTTAYEAGTLLSLFARWESWGFIRSRPRSDSLQQGGGQSLTWCNLPQRLALGPFSLWPHASSLPCSTGHELRASRPNLALGNSCSFGAASLSGLFYAHSFIPSLHPQNNATKLATVIISVLHTRKTDIQIKRCVPNVSWGNVQLQAVRSQESTVLTSMLKSALVCQRFTAWIFYITNEDI